MTLAIYKQKSIEEWKEKLYVFYGKFTTIFKAINNRQIMTRNGIKRKLSNQKLACKEGKKTTKSKYKKRKIRMYN